MNLRGIVLLLLTTSSFYEVGVATAEVPVAEQFGSGVFRPAWLDRWPFAISGDGKWLAIMSAERAGLDIFRLADGALVATLPFSSCPECVGYIDFSPDGSQLYATDGEGQLVGWSVDKWSESLNISCREPIAFSVRPDGKQIAISCAPDRIEIRNLPSAEEIVEISSTIGRGRSDRLRYSADGCELTAVDCWGGRHAKWRVTLDNVESQPVADLPKTSQFHVEDLSPNLTSMLCSVSGRLLMLNTKTGIQQREWPVWHSSDGAVYFDGGKQLAYACVRGCPVIRLIELGTGECTAELVGANEQILELKVSTDGSMAVAASEHRFWVWNLASKKLLDYCRGHSTIATIHFGLANEILISSGGTGLISPTAALGDASITTTAFDGIRLWNRSSKQLVQVFDGWHGPIMHRDGRAAIFWNDSGCLRRFDLQTSSTTWEKFLRSDRSGQLQLADRADETLTHRIWITHLVASETLDVFAAQTGNCEAILTWGRNIDGIHQLSRERYELGNEFATNILLSSDGNSLAILLQHTDFAADGDSDERTRIAIWSVNKNSLQRVAALDVSPTMYAYSLDSGVMAALGRNNTSPNSKLDAILLWDISAATTVRKWTLPDGGVDGIRVNGQQLALSPDGQWVVVGGSADGTLLLCHATTSDNVRRLKIGLKSPVTAISFSRDGAYLAIGSRDAAISLLKFASLIPK